MFTKNQLPKLQLNPNLIKPIKPLAYLFSLFLSRTPKRNSVLEKPFHWTSLSPLSLFIGLLSCQFSWIRGHRSWVDLSGDWGMELKGFWHYWGSQNYPLAHWKLETCPYTNSVRAERHAPRRLWFFWNIGPSSIRYMCPCVLISN